MAQQGTRGLTNGHQSSSDPSTAESISSSVQTVCTICETPYSLDHEQDFTFCCDQPIGSHCYQTILDEGMECEYCGQIVQPKEQKPQYILRFGHRIAAAAQASMTPQLTSSSEDQNNGSQCTIPEDASLQNSPKDTMPEDTMPEDTMPEDTMPEDTMPEDTMPEELTDERALTRVQVFLLDSFKRFLEDVRVFDEDALTQEQKLGMIRKLEMQLGLSA